MDFIRAWPTDGLWRSRAAEERRLQVLASEPAGVHCWAKGGKSLVWGKGEATEEDLSATLADVAGVVIRWQWQGARFGWDLTTSGFTLVFNAICDIHGKAQNNISLASELCGYVGFTEAWPSACTAAVGRRVWNDTSKSEAFVLCQKTQVEFIIEQSERAHSFHTRACPSACSELCCQMELMYSMFSNRSLGHSYSCCFWYMNQPQRRAKF